MNKNLLKNTIKFEDNSVLQLVCGIYHANLNLIEKKLNVSLTPKGNEISIIGNAENILITKNTLLKLYERAKLTDIIEKNDINSIINFMEDHKEKEKKINNLEKVYIETQAKKIFPRSRGQLSFMKSLTEKELIFVIGPAGTGKTFLAVSYAVFLLISGKIDKIIISRPAVEAGEKLGFLPGDLKQKIDPYLRPIYDALHENLPYQKVLKLIENEKIEIAPIAYMRGRTLNNSYIILDEAQNTSAVQMKMFLTRLGINSKMVVTGDLTQIDLPSEKNSGLLDAEKNLKKIKNISFIYLSDKDVVRHPLVSEIIKAYKK